MTLPRQRFGPGEPVKMVAVIGRLVSVLLVSGLGLIVTWSWSPSTSTPSGN